MSKSLNAQCIKVERECTHLCKSAAHARECIAATTKRGVSDHQLASYLYHLCANFAKKQDEVGRTVLHIAASCGKHELCQWLVTCTSANPNIRDYESGYTPLHRAVYYGHIDTAVRLLQFGASFDICDNEDMTVADMLCKERCTLDTLDLSMQCQAYVWGVNKNYSLGTGSDNTRKTPELLEFAKQSISITQAYLEELHSVYISSCGKVWTCGMGQNGRLGSGTSKSSLTPQLVKTQDKCIAAAIGLNHTLLLLENHVVLSFGSNHEHQLGVYPHVEMCLSPRQVCQSKFSSTNPVTGILASKYHSVFYNDSHIWTCGLNGGQLGRTASPASPYTTQPTKVSLSLNQRKITKVASCIGAIVVAVNNGDIYVLHKFQFKKMASKYLDVVKIGVFGGTLESQVVAEPASQLKIVILNSRGCIFIWKEGDQQQPARCVFGTKHSINVNDFCLTQQHLLLVTKDGQAFQGSFTNSPQPAVVASSCDKTVGKSNQFHKFIDKSDCYNVKLKRLHNIFRAVTVSADSKGNNFAIIQTHPKTALTDIPIVSESEMARQMAVLLEEASEDDAVHDAVFKVSGRVFAVHCFVLNQWAPLLAEEAAREVTVVLTQTNPFIFQQILLFLYTGTCMLLQPGPFDTKKVGKREDPLKLAIEVCNRYKIQILSKKLQKLRYEAGKICLKENCDFLPSEKLQLDRKCGVDMYDVSIKSEDNCIIKAHKCLLVARLDYFHSMFLGGWSETGKNCVLPLPFPLRVLKDLVDFIYTDDIPDLSPEDDLDHIIRLLIAGDQLLVTRLKQFCEHLLIDALTLRNAPTMLHLATIYNTSQLKASTIQFISLNLASFLQSRLLEPLDDSVLKELSDYYREFSEKKYRVLTPFPLAPLDEEIITTPSIPWPDEFSLHLKSELSVELKSLPTATKKKKTPKKSLSAAMEELELSHVEVPSPPSPQQPVQQLNDSTLRNEATSPLSTSMDMTTQTPSPSDARLVEPAVNMWSKSQFPQLHTGDKQRTKVLYPPQQKSDSCSRKLFAAPTKLSQKERKRLSSESDKQVECSPIAASPPVKPARAWATLPPIKQSDQDGIRNSISEDTNFSDIINLDKEKKANLAKMKSKPFHLTQMEDKAIDELLLFYNAANEFDERISVQRLLSQYIDRPQWITTTSKH